MGEFSPGWLALREPADVAARSASLADALLGRLDDRSPLRAIDLAAGTGSNIRYLAPRANRPQDWLLLDHDATLLAHVPERMAAWAAERRWTCAGDRGVVEVRGPRTIATLTSRVGNLATIDASWFAGRELVTASALLDLVSDAWLRTLIAACRRHDAALLFALTYDGRMHCLPADPMDDVICAAVNRHQRGDKGFGPALGPDGAMRTEAICTALGYHVRSAASDWLLSPQDSALQRQLVAGWGEAAREIEPLLDVEITAWHARRLVHIDHGRSRIVVGHRDIAAFT